MTESTTAKRGKLVGGLISDEVLDSSTSVVRSTGKGALIGLQQYFSPSEASKLAHAVFCRRALPLPVLDPTAGNGALLEAFTSRYGIEIDSDHTKAAGYTAIHGDLQRVYPLLRLADVRFPAVVLNPPFGLAWHDVEGKAVNSMLQTYRYAIGLLDECGQGMMIAARDRYWREVAPEATGAYCVVDCDDMFDGVEIPTVISFFVHPDALDEDSNPPLRLCATRSELRDLAEQVIDARNERARYVSSCADERSLKDAFRTVATEYRRRVQAEQGRAARYDLAAQGQKLACNLSAFAKVALANAGIVRNAEGLNGKSIHYFALNLREWRQIADAGKEGLLTIDPELPALVERVVHAATRDATPLYPVKPQMRLGFLEDLETLRCIESDPELEFTAGESYPLSTSTKVQCEGGERVVQLRSGEQALRATERERRLLEVRVGRHSFDESKEGIEYLLAHFDVPDPGDIATRYPAEYDRAVAVLREIEQEHLAPRGHAFKPFQVDDLARLLVKGKGPLGWDTGLGKTLGQLSWASACVRYWRCQDATLFVMPQDLLEQFQGEALRFFGRTVELIQTQADAKRVDRHVRRGGSGSWATYYEALSLVGRKDVPLPPATMVPPGRYRFERPEFDEEGEPRSRPLLSSKEFCPRCLASALQGWRGRTCERCGHVHKTLKVRTIGSLLATTFRRGVICVDELTEMQGDDSLRGKAVRGMRARHPLGGTGTPISNYVNSCFFGMWWCCGNASPRFPYDISGKPQFERDHCVIEYTYGDPEKDEAHIRKRRKILPEVSNLSVFWRLASTNMVRRRKEDSGEPIVPRYFKPITVPPGEQQLAHHKQIFTDFVRWFTETHPGSPLVRDGVVEQFAAGCGMLPKLDYASTMPESDPDHTWWGIPSTNWTPATLKVLELALEHVRAGEKVLIGSSLVDTGPWLAARLCERGARAVHITEQRDGKAQTMSPRQRGAALKAFRGGAAQVLCCGVKAVKFGHNLPEVSVVILHGPPWTYLEVKQFVDRAWRLTSTKPVVVYVVIPRGMIGERKWELVKDKGEASDLALDGQLVEKPEPEINWNDELRKMRKAGIEATGDEVPEAEIHALWMRAEGPFEPIAQPDVNVIALPTAATPPTTSSRSGRDAVVIALPERPISGEADSWDTDVEPGQQTALFAA